MKFGGRYAIRGYSSFINTNVTDAQTCEVLRLCYAMLPVNNNSLKMQNVCVNMEVYTVTIWYYGVINFTQ